jgi:hypothetical protein
VAFEPGMKETRLTSRPKVAAWPPGFRGGKSGAVEVLTELGFTMDEKH